MENHNPVTAAGVSGTAIRGAAADSPQLLVKAQRLHRWSLQLDERVGTYPNHPELWCGGFKRAQKLRMDIEVLVQSGAYDSIAAEAVEYADEYLGGLGPWAWAGYRPGLRVPWWRWRLRRSSLGR